MGLGVLEIINSLLKHLEGSVIRKCEDPGSRDMQSYQEALLSCIEQYTLNIPDFQKKEIMTIILSKIPMDQHQNVSANHMNVQYIYTKALFCVAKKHTSTFLSSTFSPTLLYSLLNLLQAKNSNVRLLALQFFEILVDRHGNHEKIYAPTIDPRKFELSGISDKPNKADELFVQKSLVKIYATIKNVLSEQTNSKEFLDAVYATVILLSLETSGVINSAIYLADLVDSMQTAAIEELALSTRNRFSLHALAISLLSFLALIVSSPEIDEYVETIITARKLNAPHMLPPLLEEYNPGLDPNTQGADVSPYFTILLHSCIISLDRH